VSSDQDVAAGSERSALQSADDALSELALRARSDMAAFREIVVRTQAELVRYAARVLGNLSEAEDVVQDAYVKAYGALTSQRFDGRSRLRTWLYSIVTHGAVDVLRSGRRRKALAQRAFQQADASSAHLPAAEARLALQELEGWLSLLPPEQRTALVLKSIEGRSSREIAEICGCSEGAVEQRLVRARATLTTREGDT
jgi:RNA polymerase sigma-70 factor, ECF subfamily